MYLSLFERYSAWFVRDVGRVRGKVETDEPVSMLTAGPSASAELRVSYSKYLPVSRVQLAAHHRQTHAERIGHTHCTRRSKICVQIIE
jgi:hypothetical protein